jgi:hypothetical protein
MQSDGDRLLALGLKKSPTFRQLVNRLEQSDVIVYIDVRPDMPGHLGGALRFLAKSARARFLRVNLNRVYPVTTLVALLGHELQHAVEVADAPDVMSAEDLRVLYRRVGVCTGPDSYDSLAARRTGIRVLEELRRRDNGLRLVKTPAAPSLPAADGQEVDWPTSPALERPTIGNGVDDHS